MVNLAAGKNSTDIALAVDAIEIAVNERPDVVVIASSDSDFAPVVARLRERGCRVVGLGQHGKVGQETRGIYDDYEVFEHRGGDDAAPAPRKRSARAASAASARSGLGGTTPRAAGKKAAAKTTKTAAKKNAGAKTPRKTAAGRKTRAAPTAQADPPSLADLGVEAEIEALSRADRDAPILGDDPFEAPRAVGRKKAARTPAKKATASPDANADADAAATPASMPKHAAKRAAHATPKQPPNAASVEPRSSTTLDAVLHALPELARGATLNFNDVGQRLRAAGLLSKSGSSMKLLRQFAGDVILEPADRPSRVRLAGL